MNYTVSDFYNTFSDKLKIVSGSGGMSRQITDAGFLDYEMEPDLKNKYINTNFQEGQLIVTTFLYAKDNPFLVTDAVKHLIAKGVSALVIKNVFHIPLNETISRYADSKNFPIFVIDSKDIYVETIIYNVKKRCELFHDIHYFQRKIEFILSQNLNGEKIRECAKALNPSMNEEYFNIYIQFDGLFSEQSFISCHEAFSHSDIYTPGNNLVFCDTAILVTFSHENIAEYYTNPQITHIIETVTNGLEYTSIGASDYHLKLEDFKVSILECIHASSVHNENVASYMMYSDLGTYKLLLPFFKTEEMQRFADTILNQLTDYDIENNSHLYITLKNFVANGCNLVDTAGVISQHVNTVRYRMDKITEITGLDYKKHDDLEQLSIAIKIDNCKDFI